MTSGQPPQQQELPDKTAQLLMLLAAYQQSTQALRSQLSGYVAALWRSLGVYRNDQMAQFVAQVVPAVMGAQQQMASLTTAHIAQQTALARDVPFAPAALDPTKVSGAAVRNGTPPTDVYERPFHLVWRQLGEAKGQAEAHQTAVDAGTPVEDAPAQPAADYVEKAIQSGLDRAVQAALTDLQLAKTHSASQAIAADPRIIGWRRALEGSYSCGLCIVASTQVYSRGRSEKPKLMPIHPGCDCSVQPIYADQDIAQVLNENLLGDVHAAIAERFGKSSAAARSIPGARDGKGRPVMYRDFVVTHDHSELGPVLGLRGAEFTGAKQLTK